MTTLIYSEDCAYCKDVFYYIQNHPELDALIRVYDIQDGVPQVVTQVPSLVTAQGTLYSGATQVKGYLQSLLPLNIQKSPYSSNVPSARLDKKSNSKYFAFTDFGKTVKPVITPELSARINQPIDQALTNLKTR
jgi:hypothetical protein